MSYSSPLSSVILLVITLSHFVCAEPEHHQAKQRGKQLQRLLQQNADIRTLRKQDFSFADLRRAILAKKNLADRLKKRSFNEAYNSPEYQRGEKLFTVDLSGVTLQGANLERADLHGANLISVNLRHAKLRKVNLRGAVLNNARLSNADLRRADLRNARLAYADLRNADLRNANLQGANLTRADLRGAILTGAIFDKAILKGTLLDEKVSLDEALSRR